MEKKRLEYIDIAKGICMLLIVMSHANGYAKLEYGDRVFCALALSSFFMLSGITFNPSNNGKQFICKTVNRLFIPLMIFYLAFSVILPNILTLVGYQGLRSDNVAGWSSLLHLVVDEIFPNMPVWFISALFFADLLLWSVIQLAKRWCPKHEAWFIAIAAMLLGTAGYAAGYNKLQVWLFIDCSFTALPFLTLGYLLSHHTKLLTKQFNKPLSILTVVVCFVYIWLFTVPHSFLRNRFPETIDGYWWFYSCGIIGSVSMLVLCRLIGSCKIASYYGRNTLLILCTHMMILQNLNFVTKHFENGWISFIVLVVITMAAYLLIIPLANKYLGWALGRKDYLRCSSDK